MKGNDDLRQDAVMEQVFGLLNDLLDEDPETRSRKLNVRTYKVVPLSQRSGILEWCQNTQLDNVDFSILLRLLLFFYFSFTIFSPVV